VASEWQRLAALVCPYVAACSPASGTNANAAATTAKAEIGSARAPGVIAETAHDLTRGSASAPWPTAVPVRLLANGSPLQIGSAPSVVADWQMMTTVVVVPRVSQAGSWLSRRRQPARGQGPSDSAIAAGLAVMAGHPRQRPRAAAGLPPGGSSRTRGAGPVPAAAGSLCAPWLVPCGRRPLRLQRPRCGARDPTEAPTRPACFAAESRS